MLNIIWKPIEQADKAKSIIALCPAWITPFGTEYPEHLVMCWWSKGDDLNKPQWASGSGGKHFPTHFIYYEELHQSFKDQMTTQ